MAAEGRGVTSRAIVPLRHPLARLAAPSLLAGAAVVLVGTAAAFAQSARAAPACSYRLGAAALTDAGGTEVALKVTPSTPACKPPSALRAVRIRIYSRAGSLRGVRVLRGVRAPNGRAAVTLKGLVRRQRLRVNVSFGTRVLTARAIVRLRPDLVLRTAAPATSVAAATPSTITVTVAERNGDVGTTARIDALNGTSPLASTTVRVAPRGRLRVAVSITLPTAGQYTLVLQATDTTGRETATANNTAQLTVEAGDFALDPAQVLVPR